MARTEVLTQEQAEILTAAQTVRTLQDKYVVARDAALSAKVAWERAAENAKVAAGELTRAKVALNEMVAGNDDSWQWNHGPV